MARLNIVELSKLIPGLRTFEGALAKKISAELQLRRSVLACLLWENQFYEDGVKIAGRIRYLVPKVEPAKVAALAMEARSKMKLRHAPLLLVREMARHATHRKFVAETLEQVIQRADELAEFVAIYWKDGRMPLSAQVKKGLAAAFCKFDEYALAKYNRDGPIKLRDVLFLVHAKPVDESQAALWKRLVAGELATPDTWEVALSAGGDQRGALGAFTQRTQAGCAGAAPQSAKHGAGEGGRGAGLGCPEGDEDRPRAAIPVSSRRRDTRRSGRPSWSRPCSHALPRRRS